MNRDKAHLLVVDDSPSMRRVICELLTELGFRRVDEAPDGTAALERFRHDDYDVIITDWNMPHMNGLELLKAIRHAPEHADTPVLVLTGQVSANRVVEALEAGADGFVAKPFITPALVDKVVKLVAARPPVLDLVPSLLGTVP